MASSAPASPTPVVARGSASAPDSAPASVIVNGRPQSLQSTPAQTNALDFLRGCGLTGAKEGCAEGECGACAILVARPAGPDGTTWTSINACLLPAASLEGQEVVTSEGLGSPDHLHPVQHELAVRGGSQCGYCTPGFACSMAAEFYRADRGPASDAPRQPADSEHGPNGFDLHALAGNLCRCTGYRPIRDAAYALGQPDPSDPMTQRRDRPAPTTRSTRHETPAGTYARATSLTETFELLREHPEAVLVAGSTDWGVDVNLKGVRAAYAIGIDHVTELRTLRIGDDAIELGAALTLSELEHGLCGRVPLLDQMFPQFASRLIRNGATLGGNLGTASPIGDAPPALLALESEVVLASAAGERTVPLSAYFTGYRQTVRRPDEVIRAVRIPLPLSPIADFHKIAKRRFDDISSVAVGFALRVDEGIVTRARIGLGGVAATPVRALATEAQLEGRPWARDEVIRAAEVLRREGTPMDDHRASSAYRTALLGTALLRLHAEHSREGAGA